VTNEQVEHGGQVGHRDLPHTADVRIEAWGPSLEACLEQAVAGLVETFADLSAARVAGEVTFELADAPAEDLLVAVLDEVIYRLDTESVLPVRSDVQRAGAGASWSVRFEVAPAAGAELIGAVPKATSLHGLLVERSANGWRCEVTVDI
jgi:SHS2 domain-containing protein